MSCEYKGCNSQIFFKCETCKPETSYCKFHSRDHLRLLPAHKLKGLCIKIDRDSKEALLMNIEGFMSRVVNKKKQLLCELNDSMKELIDKFNTKLTELREAEDLYLKALEKLKQEKYINSSVQDKITEFIITMIQNSTKAEEEVKWINKEVIYSINNIPTIHCFKKGNNVLTCINTLLNFDNNIEITGLSHNFSTDSGCCYVNNEKMFVYGGSNNDGFSYLIDLKLMTGQNLGSRKKKYTHSCCYHNGSIYTFGGYSTNNAELSDVEVYDFKAWRSLSSLPQADKFLSTEILGENIGVIGYNSAFLTIYNITANSFVKTASLTVNTRKIFVCAKWKTYIFEKNKLIRMIIDNFNDQQILSTSTGIDNNWIIGPAIVHNNNIYFLTDGSKLYCLNLETEGIRLIRSVS